MEIINIKYNVPKQLDTIMELCLNNTYVIYNGQRYRQIEGDPMGSSLSPVTAKLNVDEFEQQALRSTRLKPSLWLTIRYHQIR